MKAILIITTVLFIVVFPYHQSSAQIEFTRHELEVTNGDVIGGSIKFVGDLDNDGDMDILLNYNFGLTWYENDGDLEFIEHELPDADEMSVLNVDISDIDSDGDLDIIKVCSHGTDLKLSWLENDEDQTFSENVISRIENREPRDVVVFDIDQDDNLDIITGDENYGYLMLWLNDGELNFELSSFNRGATKFLIPFDLDEDDDIDVVAFHHQGNFGWWENNGNEEFEYFELYDEFDGRSSLSFIMEDMDNDSDNDFIYSDAYINPIVIENLGNQEFAHHIIDDGEYTNWYVVTGDLDADSDVDVIGVYSNDGILAWWENEGDFEFIVHDLDELGDASEIFVADLDLDRDLDIIFASYGDNDGLYWLENDLDPSAPESFDRISPLNFSTVAVNEVPVTWETAVDDDENDVVEYHLSWSLDPDFAEENIWQTVTNDTTFTISELGDLDELPEDSTIYWKVYATDNFDFVTWANDDSSAWAFTIDLTPKPYDLVADLDDEDQTVTLTWEAGPYPVELEELIYDDNSQTGFTRTPDTILATRMSPEQPCRLHELSFFVSTDGEGGEFNAAIFEWDGDEPAVDPLFEQEISGLPVTGGEWITLDVYRYRLNFDSDFVIGFGSIDAVTNIGIDEEVDNGHSWELSDGNWDTWDGTYFIRALVQYTDNRYAVLEGDLDDFIRFHIYRDGEEIERTTGTTHTDQLEGYGSYEYTVSALYDEGMSDLAGPVIVNYTSVADNSKSAIPNKFAITKVFPNPFNPSTTVTVGMPQSASLQVIVFNLIGQEVATLASSYFAAGYHSFVFNSVDLTSGIYIIRANIQGEYSDTRKIVLMK